MQAFLVKTSLWLALVASQVARSVSASSPMQPLAEKLKYSGMTLTNGKYCPNITYDSNVTTLALKHIATIGTNALSIVVTQYQATHNSTDIWSVCHSENFIFTQEK